MARAAAQILSGGIVRTNNSPAEAPLTPFSPFRRAERSNRYFSRRISHESPSENAGQWRGKRNNKQSPWLIPTGFQCRPHRDTPSASSPKGSTRTMHGVRVYVLLSSLKGVRWRRVEAPAIAEDGGRNQTAGSNKRPTLAHTHGGGRNRPLPVTIFLTYIGVLTPYCSGLQRLEIQGNTLGTFSSSLFCFWLQKSFLTLSSHRMQSLIRSAAYIIGITFAAQPMAFPASPIQSSCLLAIDNN